MAEKDIVESERPERTPPLQAPAIALAFGSLLGLAVIAVLLTLVGYQIVLPNGSSEWSDAWGCWLADLDSNTVAQIVPSIVVAIFVFAVGTAFVVAQVVPPARGSRATTTLQGRRMARAIAPAPALIVGSVLAVLVSDNIVAGSISVAILVGSFIYLLISLWSMLTILFDATDPVRFKALLLKKATEAANCLANNPPCKRVGYLIRPPDITPILSRNTGQHGRQAATDALYEIVRTARGWVRVAARSNDSRELHESLQCLLAIAGIYANKVLGTVELNAVPTDYWGSEKLPQFNPLYRSPVTRTETVIGSQGPIDTRESIDAQNPTEKPTANDGTVQQPFDDEPVATYKRANVSSLNPWAPPRLVEDKTDVSIASTWLANEIGRAVVRAIELGIEANSLLDRDTFRLLNTLTNAAEIFHDCAPLCSTKSIQTNVKRSGEVLTWNAGVMVRYLVEVGLGVRHSSPDKSEWYREPCARLALLNRTFADSKRDGADELVTGSAAAVLLVAVSLIDSYMQRTIDASGLPDDDSADGGPQHRLDKQDRLDQQADHQGVPTASQDDDVGVERPDVPLQTVHEQWNAAVETLFGSIRRAAGGGLSTRASVSDTARLAFPPEADAGNPSIFEPEERLVVDHSAEFWTRDRLEKLLQRLLLQQASVEDQYSGDTLRVGEENAQQSAR